MRQELQAAVHKRLIFTDGLSSKHHYYARRQGAQVKISRGVYLTVDVFQEAQTWWEKQEIVAYVRILAAQRRMKEVVFCKESALFLYGIQQGRISPHVFVRSGHAYGQHLDFPAVSVENTLILPAGKVRLCHSALTHSEKQEIGGLTCVGLTQLLVECATFRSTREALALASALLSAVVRYPLTRDADGRVGAERIRGEALRGIGLREGFPRRRRAQRIVEAASADCDSIAEAYLVALLHEQGFYGWKQQYEVQTHRGKRLIDCAFPEQKIAIEIEGKVKDSLFDRSTSDGHMAYYKRAAEISLIGWVVVPIPATDVLYYPGSAAQTLSSALQMAA